MRTAEALSLEVKEEKIGRDKTFLRLQDAEANRINLVIGRRTDTMTSIQFDVGWFGSMAFGRVMARQIIAELKKAEAFLEDWAPEKTDW